MAGKFTWKKAVLLGSIYQAYPVLLCLWALNENPNSRLVGFVGIFVIAEALLAVLLNNWRSRSHAEVVDEMELAIRQKVQLMTSSVTQIALGSTVLVYLSVYREMPTLLALMLVAVPAILAETFGNVYYRRI